jgi:hypothetical protein
VLREVNACALNTCAMKDKEDAEANLAKAKANLADAKMSLAEAEARLKRLEADKAPRADVTAARADVTAARADVTVARSSYDRAMDVVKSAIDANRSTSHSDRIVRFSLSADVRVRLLRDLKDWQAGETFDVTGFTGKTGLITFSDVLYVRAAGLDVMRRLDKDPYLVIYGTPGIGKSTLLQLLLLRALVKGDPVLLHIRGHNILFQMVDDEHVSMKRINFYEWSDSRKDLPLMKDVFVCYDSPAGFQVTIGDAVHFKGVAIVHSPSGAINNSKKSRGTMFCYFPNPPLGELIDFGAVVGIGADDMRRLVARYGPSMRHVCDPDVEVTIESAINDLVGAGIEGLDRAREPTPEMHRIMVMIPTPPPLIGTMLVFASDYIRDKVVARFSDQYAVDLLSLANTVDLHGSLRCQIFEARMLDLLSRPAEIVFKAGDDSGQVVQQSLRIASGSITLRLEGGIYSLPDGESTLRHGVLYRPPHSNNEGWDALIVENDSTAYLLQMTVAVKHEVKYGGINAGSQFLKGRGFKGTVHLVFLVPPALFDRFAVPQRMLNVDEKESAASTQARWPQAKWQVGKVDGADFWSGASDIQKNAASIKVRAKKGK